MLDYCAHEKLSGGRAERQARHYYDLVKLADHDQGKGAIEDDFHLFEVVSRDKEMLFPAAWARYSEAKRGSLRLVPNPPLSRLLEDDFQKMIRSGMFGTEPPPWGESFQSSEIEPATKPTARLHGSSSFASMDQTKGPLVTGIPLDMDWTTSTHMTRPSEGFLS